MIPKIIHYIWLGGQPLPELANKCIASWKKYCPDYEIKRWDENNLNLDLCPYVREAYEAKKYAFASDVLRYQVLYEFGGIYLDTDVELIKPIEEFLSDKLFMGFETKYNVAPGLIIGAEKQNCHLKNLINDYKNEKFNLDNGKFNLTTIVERTTNYLTKLGLKEDNGEIQYFNDIKIYPKEYFCPINVITSKKKITKLTHSIHWYNASWYSPWQKFKKNLKKVLNFLTFGHFGKTLEKKRHK